MKFGKKKLQKRNKEEKESKRKRKRLHKKTTIVES